MIKSYLTNVALIALIIGLYWFNDIEHETEKEMPPLTSLTSSQISHISISRSDSGDIELIKSTTGWEITQPLKATANFKRIELLLSFLDTPSYAQQEAGDDKMLSQFELDPASIVLTLDGHSVKFGGLEPISKHRYVLVDNVIHLITDRVTPLLRANATSFIENKLISNTKITKLELPLLNSNNALLTDSIIIENVNGHWQSNVAEITTNRLTAIVENWQHAYALQVLPLKDLALTNSTLHTVKIWFNNEACATEYLLTLSNDALFIIDQKQLLKYQFTRASLPQLLPSQP